MVWEVIATASRTLELASILGLSWDYEEQTGPEPTVSSRDASHRVKALCDTLLSRLRHQCHTVTINGHRDWSPIRASSTRTVRLHAASILTL